MKDDGGTELNRSGSSVLNAFFGLRKFEREKTALLKLTEKDPVGSYLKSIREFRMIIGEGRTSELLGALSGLLCRMRLMQTAVTTTVNRRHAERMLHELAVRRSMNLGLQAEDIRG